MVPDMAVICPRPRRRVLAFFAYAGRTGPRARAVRPCAGQAAGLTDGFATGAHLGLRGNSDVWERLLACPADPELPPQL